MSSCVISCILVICCLLIGGLGLQCFKCGQYNDGVGSITPCLNYTHMQLQDCPTMEHVYCIKYVTEGTTIRDCVQKCVEKETWGTRSYCCHEDGCNTSSQTRHFFTLMAVCLSLLYHLTH